MHFKFRSLKAGLIKTLFKAIKHNKMNTKKNPCEPASDYSYFSCIMQKMVKRTNCKPFWMTMINSDLAPCKNYSMLRKYFEMSNELNMMDEKTLYDTYQCLKPCSFMEYKVTNRESDKRFC